MLPVTGARTGHTAHTVLILFLFFLMATSHVTAAVLPDFNYIFITVANDAGAKYNSYSNNTYNIRFEGVDRGLNALHVSTDPAANFGQVTMTDSQSGTFYATDSGGKGYEDEILLMVAVNGTIPDDFSLRVTSDGYTWTPNPVSNRPPDLVNVTYQPVALDETFTNDDFIYGPQIWKPTGNEAIYPIFYGQDLTDTANTFQILFVDLNSGVLRPDTSLQNQGAVRINYTLQNLETFAAFNVYGYCKNSNNGEEMVAWGNALVEPKALSGYSVIGQPPAILTLPGQTNPPTDPDNDGLYEDMSGNGAASYTDVVLFFKNLDWITENEPVSAFDFSGNGAIAFKDIVVLFKEV
jgi:PKD repeat protein